SPDASRLPGKRPLDMPRKLLNILFSVVVAACVWACYGGTAAITDLPNPGEDDPPPGAPPDLPRVQVDLPPAQVPGNVRVVTNGDDLQGAIDDAKPGDVIALQP